MKAEEAYWAGRLSYSEIATLRAALRRSVDWSDLGDNGKFYGKSWSKNEREFIRNCERLLGKLKVEYKARRLDAEGKG